MSRLHRMRQVLAAQAPKTAPEEKPQPEPPKEKGTQITHTCGHKVGVSHLEGLKCPACRHADRTAKNAAKKSDVRLPMEKKPEEEGRLPHGSIFSAFYDATAKRWHGTLSLSGTMYSERVAFRADSGAVMKLLKLLDQQYREWLKQRPAKDVEPPAGS